MHVSSPMPMPLPTPRNRPLPYTSSYNLLLPAFLSISKLTASPNMLLFPWLPGSPPSTSAIPPSARALLSYGSSAFVDGADGEGDLPSIFSCSRETGSPSGGAMLFLEKLAWAKVPRTVAEWGSLGDAEGMVDGGNEMGRWWEVGVWYGAGLWEMGVVMAWVGRYYIRGTKGSRGGG